MKSRFCGYMALAATLAACQAVPPPVSAPVAAASDDSPQVHDTVGTPRATLPQVAPAGPIAPNYTDRALQTQVKLPTLEDLKGLIPERLTRDELEEVQREVAEIAEAEAANYPDGDGGPVAASSTDHPAIGMQAPLPEDQATRDEEPAFQDAHRQVAALPVDDRTRQSSVDEAAGLEPDRTVSAKGGGRGGARAGGRSGGARSVGRGGGSGGARSFGGGGQRGGSRSYAGGGQGKGGNGAGSARSFGAGGPSRSLGDRSGGRGGKREGLVAGPGQGVGQGGHAGRGGKGGNGGQNLDRPGRGRGSDSGNWGRTAGPEGVRGNGGRDGVRPKGGRDGVRGNGPRARGDRRYVREHGRDRFHPDRRFIRDRFAYRRFFRSFFYDDSFFFPLVYSGIPLYVMYCGDPVLGFLSPCGVYPFWAVDPWVSGLGPAPWALGGPGPLGGPFGGAYPGPIPGPYGGALGGPLGGPIPGPYGGALGGPLGGPIPGPYGGALGGPLGGPIPGPYGGALDSPLGGPIPGPYGGALGGPLGGPIPGPYGGAVGDPYGGSDPGSVPGAF